VLANQLVSLLQALSGPLPALLNSLSGLNMVTLPNLDNLANGLVIAPWDVAAVQGLVRGGRSYLGLSANQTPMVCQQGYLPPSQWRSVNDLSLVPAPMNAHCAEAGKNWRGSAQAR
jgi:phospholipid/cholesterol/gamma-HCH transport system substrate-binding protein